MSDLIKEFKDSGNCIIDLPILYKKWNKTFTLSRYHSEYTLLKKKGKNNNLKVSISESQALEIIKELNLLEVKSDTFNNASTYRAQVDIEGDIERLMVTYDEKIQEATIVGNIIRTYRNAIYQK